MDSHSPEDFLTESIQFVVEDVVFEIEEPTLLRQWMHEVIKRENKELNSITYIFCSDEYLHKINMEYLHHDTYTDIITFSLSDENIESDIFISIDRIKENATDIGIGFKEELQRVLIHGILHLCGYKDKTDKEQELMTHKEDEALTFLAQLILSQ